MRDLVLYGNHESGHSYKVRSFLTLAGVPHRYVWVDLDVPRAERPEEFRRASQFGEVPVRVADGVPSPVQRHPASPGAGDGEVRTPGGLQWEQRHFFW